MLVALIKNAKPKLAEPLNDNEAQNPNLRQIKNLKGTKK